MRTWEEEEDAANEDPYGETDGLSIGSPIDESDSSLSPSLSQSLLPPLSPPEDGRRNATPVYHNDDDFCLEPPR